ncbi:hypothetical protein KIN20_003622 [Parelaphostrongylus tenuis]|uniref:LTD domain-containing protein n=1 Tax=Parelaphostrongylus tenuis TaxID=148309 RepID=A0AAD5M0H2_PARTN|nr:hypothetical protein KIN20_003622 [Parelaphostrongylus tenuis]
MEVEIPSVRSRFGDANAFYPHEKEEFQDLNSRLERYIALVKQLERENVEMVDELRHLHDSWGVQNTEFKANFSKALVMARDEAIVALLQNAENSIRAKRINDNIDLHKRRIEFIRQAEQADRARCAELRSQISKAEADLELQMRENGRLADERAQLSAQNANLYMEYDRLWQEIDRVRLELAEYRAREERLLAEKDFLMRVQQQEALELANLLSESSFDARKFFENDIAHAIRDIKDEYEQSHNLIRKTVTGYYRQKVDEIRKIAESMCADENKHRLVQIDRIKQLLEDLRSRSRPIEEQNQLLENEYRQLQHQIRDDEERYETEKRRCDDEYREVFNTYQRLLAEQGSMAEVTLLELEIYKKMIECEERRWRHGEIVKDRMSVEQVTKHRTYVGDIRIQDCDEYGKHIVVENAGKTEQRMTGYRLSRIVDGRERSFTFPALFVLHPGQTVQVSARGYVHERHGHHHHLEFDEDTTWGTGGNVVTRLYNAKGIEIASFEVISI